MDPRVLLYRAYRLRRLILASVALPVLVVASIAAAKGPAALVFLLPALCVPVAHALRYPNAWTETLTVSLVLAILLAIAGTIGPEIGVFGLSLRIAGLALAGLLLFLALGAIVPSVLSQGRPADLEVRARRRSRLPANDVRERITLHPGRRDGRVVCGEADADGVFSVTIRLPEVGGLLGGACSEEDGEEAGPAEVRLFAQIIGSTAERHEVMAIEEGSREPTFTRHEFRDLGDGCRITVYERTEAMPAGLRLGFWLQDYMADHLTDEIDLAEGRSSRANRAATQDHLLFSLARRMSRGRAQTA